MADTNEPNGPFLFDTSAESWFRATRDPAARDWLAAYVERHLILISSITLIEAHHGYALALSRAADSHRAVILAARARFLGNPERVLPVDAAAGLAAAELMAMVPQPPSPPKRTHRAVESRADRLARWRFDCVIAATALANRLPLMHNNPEDFEALRAAIEIQPHRLPGLGPLELYRSVRTAQLKRRTAS